MSIWTGEVNDPFAFKAEVGFYDTTLRDGEQTVGVVLDPQQKLEIARGLAEAGVERIEAGFPRVSQDDWDAVQLIAEAGLSAEIWGFSRAVRADVEALVELGVQASVIESPISDLKLEALGVAREEMLRRIRDAVAYAVENGIKVAYFGVDSTRADPDFFDEAYAAAVGAGASEVVVVDTIGVAEPGRDATRSSSERARWSCPRPLPRPQRLRARDRERDRSDPRRRTLDPRDDQRDGGAGRKREHRRDRTGAARALRRGDEARPRARA